jgi:hypothetical protein
MFLGITTPLFILDKNTLSFKIAKGLIGMDKLTGMFIKKFENKFI